MKIGIDSKLPVEEKTKLYKEKLDNPIMLGYLIHILTDRFYNEYIFKHFYIYTKVEK